MAFISNYGGDYAHRRQKEIGRNLLIARVVLKMSQDEVAQILGCSRKRYDRAEQGLTPLAIGELELLAYKFDMSFSELIGQNKVVESLTKTE